MECGGWERSAGGWGGRERGCEVVSCGLRNAMIHQPSALRHQPSAISHHQPSSAISHQPSAILSHDTSVIQSAIRTIWICVDLYGSSGVQRPKHHDPSRSLQIPPDPTRSPTGSPRPKWSPEAGASWLTADSAEPNPSLCFQTRSNFAAGSASATGWSGGGYGHGDMGVAVEWGWDGDMGGNVDGNVDGSVDGSVDGDRAERGWR